MGAEMANILLENTPASARKYLKMVEATWKYIKLLKKYLEKIAYNCLAIFIALKLH